ncbi:MAG TPA: ZIP family metal transporter [Elusimicrobiales bacterium]|nr:ZIP family metal transporter [Elusimicrobiales bacterium]
MNGTDNFGWIAAFALAAAAVNGAGIYAIYFNERWAERAKGWMMCFAAGLLISSSLMFAFPEAAEKNHDAGFAALAGFLFIFFSNKFIKKTAGERHLAFGITAVEGIAIHSFVDGVIYAVAFSVSLLIGLASALGLVIHEFAEGAITFSFLLKGGMHRKKAAVFAFFVAALTTPLGAFIAYPFVSGLSDTILGLLLGFVVGVLIYVSASHLLPEAQEHERGHSTLAFLSGVGVAILMIFARHSH